MPEALLDFDSNTTVAIGGYTAASGVLDVASTSTFNGGTYPGKFSVVVRDQITGAEIVTLTVTGFNSSTQMAVTAETLDTNAVVGDFVEAALSKRAFIAYVAENSSANISTTFASLPAPGTVGRIAYFTDSVYDFARDTGSAWVFYRGGVLVTPPPSSGWTWSDQGTSTVASTNGPLLINFQGARNGWRHYYRNTPSAPYVLTFRINRTYFNQDGASAPNDGQGVSFMDGTGGFIAYYWIAQAGTKGFLIEKWLSNTSFSGSYNGTVGSNWIDVLSFNFTQFLQVEDDGTNLIWRYSIFGTPGTWVTFDTRSRTDWLGSGPTRIAISNRSSSTSQGAFMEVIDLTGL